MAFERDVAILGGCGHVGLPLGMAFADHGRTVVLCDTNAAAVEVVNSGRMPFREAGAEELLPSVIASGRLTASLGVGLSSAEVVVVVIGTPVDEYLNPDIGAVLRALDGAADHLVDGQLLVLRSTVYPGVTALVEKRLAALGKTLDVAFCPERIAEGHALDELKLAPADRLGSACPCGGACRRAVSQPDARYRRAAAGGGGAGQALHQHVALHQVRNGQPVVHDRQRLRPGLRSHPSCGDLPLPARRGHARPRLRSLRRLFKDTMQIAAFNENRFTLGHASVMINEGLPLYVVRKLERRYDLSSMTVGNLGMAFKGGSDDIRSSLSYKLKHLLSIKARAVLCTDPYVTVDPDIRPLESVLASSDLVVVAIPHRSMPSWRWRFRWSTSSTFSAAAS